MEKIIAFSIRNKLIIFLLTAIMMGFGVYSLFNIPIGAVPDITNNQVQVITVSRNLATEEIEQFITYPIELEMANLPGVHEIRSISKFGLSVVTIVFDDNIGTFLPRQLIAEKIKSAEQKIPAGFGSPMMGPISTGLGEIYQYTLDVKPEHASRYTLTDLRTLQDWIVKRQLSGISGVVEINTWGGFLKEYEVAVNPERLRSMNLSVAEVFKALQSNNSAAGGGYIEKTNESYFIRGEGLVSSLDDVERIVVDVRNGVPVLVKDIATVGFGHAVRFGAITGNGEGEKVLGQIMMLKDANSGKVIEEVKKRVTEIQNTLPEGVFINPIVDRSDLIGRTTFTVAENLILGCLIVVFVVVLLLGNFRSGFVVASVIPLSLLFALSLMYLFGVDANLMSLGAIDFGIIIDGAVIIVEFIAFQITAQQATMQQLSGRELQLFKDKVTVGGATKMMQSALFGQLIILIVFIPILSLSGVEGKMFKPMALTFSFALVGAIILCFTYVPVVSALFLKPAPENKRNISRRLMDWIERMHEPTMVWALHHKKIVLGSAVVLLLSAVLLFTRMGGEFVPTLDEGDFVIQPVLKTGTTLSKTIETITEMEKILLQFPEVDQVVSRIGAAEIPTDPMSMEESDVIIKLKPRKEWVTASDKDALADKFKEALTIIPGIEYEFTQPIEMRFNELITGVRADLAVKIFGEDMDVLSKKAFEIEKLIRPVEGAADIIVEKVSGLPQMSVLYDRAKIARYGLNILELNTLVSAGFAGLTAGSVFEGEKRFDLVIRFEKQSRADIENLRNMYVTLPTGGQIPLRELAEIRYSKGPAKISRDNTRRRIVVGINVRGRDLESVVKDVQTLIEANVKLPAGYSITYGGQFENLRSARARLMIAVPVALVLIFFLLYFAFSSVRDALMIYSAIPLSAVGGVVFLWIRDLPFSISAGVGFIALFGIAVLNGIVLIEHFKELKAHGLHDMKARILKGTKERLRPVLLTASAAALGFLPMAVSTNAGAEVQRPLATVVIGGLVSATVLTLVVLPVLYSIFDTNRSVKKHTPPIVLLILFALIIPFTSSAQQPRVVTMEEAIDLAVKNNAGLKSSYYAVEQSRALAKTSFDAPRPVVYFSRDENNLPPVGDALNVWGIQQNFRFPTVYAKQRQAFDGATRMQEQQYAMDSRKLAQDVSKAYITILYGQNLVKRYLFLDSIYTGFSLAADKRFAVGETNYLEKLTAETKKREAQLQVRQAQASIQSAYAELARWLQVNEEIRVVDSELLKIELEPINLSEHPGLLYFEQSKQTATLTNQVEKNKWLPDIHVAYFQGRNQAEDNKLYPGVQLGLAVPLWFGVQRASIQATQMQVERVNQQAEDFRLALTTRYVQLQRELDKHREALDFYDTTGRRLVEETINTAQRSFLSGELNFLQYVQAMDQAVVIEMNYLLSLYQYNITVIELNYLMY
ncbi:MAG TPA: CusA/CzcA family heavy metal efflux RND transporter [Cyclobacteriaceae bacterium]|nr:CusA/CzcA family heavy metal efflux RND transporter [Cyclobacteriaceae bacterium]HRJ81139.1 CusA/CzcA family heavy metal efflux RND transporter [Cyclobacteriaceae bacterium]